MHPRHTLYAVAWDMIVLPTDHTQKAAAERTEIKRACRIYARCAGWRLSLSFATYGGSEVWKLEKRVPAQLADKVTLLDYGYRDEFIGSLQECCLKIAAHDQETNNDDEVWAALDKWKADHGGWNYSNQ